MHCCLATQPSGVLRPGGGGGGCGSGGGGCGGGGGCVGGGSGGLVVAHHQPATVGEATIEPLEAAAPGLG